MSSTPLRRLPAAFVEAGLISFVTSSVVTIVSSTSHTSGALPTYQGLTANVHTTWPIAWLAVFLARPAVRKIVEQIFRHNRATGEQAVTPRRGRSANSAGRHSRVAPPIR